MTADELALARMDDDGYGSAITTTPPGPFAVRVRREVTQAALKRRAADGPVCGRCGRVAVGWPLERGDRCSPRDWYRCIRDPFTVMQEATS
jgi:hypothetical protein